MIYDQYNAVRNPCAHDCTPKTGARCIFRPVTTLAAIRQEPPTTPTPEVKFVNAVTAGGSVKFLPAA